MIEGFGNVLKLDHCP